MRKMKQLMVLVLSFLQLMAMCIMPGAVYAADNRTYEATEADRILVEKLEAFGAITDVEADITAKVTRRQMAELVADYMRIPSYSQTESPFVDVTTKDASVGAIVALYDLKVITGDDSFHFYPDAFLTYDEALVFMVNAVGHKMFAVRNGGYPTGYHHVAIRLGLLDDLQMTSGKDEVILRDVYKMMEAGFEAPAVTTNGIEKGEVVFRVSDTEDFLSDVYGITTRKGIITGSEDTHLTSAESNLTDEQIEINHQVYDTPGYIYATSLGYSVNYYLTEDESGDTVIAYVEESRLLNSVIQIDAEDILPSKTTNTRIYYEDENQKERHVKFANAVDVIYNGRCYRNYGDLSNVLPASGYIKALDNTGDKVADVLFVYDYRNIVIETVDAYNSLITAKPTSPGATPEKIEVDLEKGNARIYSYPQNKQILSVDRVVAGNVASVMESKGEPKLTTIYVCNETVTGTIEEVSSEYGYKIDGTYYKTAEDYFGLALKAGVSGKFSIDIGGKIAYAQYDAEAGVGMTYAIVTGIDQKTSGVEEEVSIRLYTQEKQFVTAPFADKVKIDKTMYNDANGTDADDILSLFATKDQDSGLYIIENPYVIKFGMSNGKITRLELPKTAETAEKGEFALIADDIVEMVPRSSGMYIRTEASYAFPAYAPKNAIVFVTPSLDDLTETEDYDVLENLPERHYMKSTGNDTGGVYHIYTEGTAVYTSNTSDVLTANVILLRGVKKADTAGTSSSNQIQVITKVTEAVDEDGSACKKLYFGTNGAMLADRVTLEMDGTTKYDLSPDSPEINSLKPGYAIFCTYNNDNKIEKINVKAKYENGAFVSSFKISAGNIGKEEGKDATVSGTVEVVDSLSGAITITLDGADTEGLQMVVRADASSAVSVYRGDTQKITTETISAISSGDRVIIRLKNYFTIQSLIAFR